MSKIDKARRGFLKLIPGAPVGVAVAAKEVAASMGLSGPINPVAGYLGGNIGYAKAQAIPGSSTVPWFVDAFKQFMSAETIENHRNSAKGMARVLDADIAAMRSISPSQAYQMQVERCYERLRKQEKSYIDKEMERWTKDNPGAALAQKVLG